MTTPCRSQGLTISRRRQATAVKKILAIHWSRLLTVTFALASSALGSCRRRTPDVGGARLARTNCAVCHTFPEPNLLDKHTWQSGVLPQMARRVGATPESASAVWLRNPYLPVLATHMSKTDWEKIVAYYRDSAPDRLPEASLPAQPELDPAFFATGPFVPNLKSSGIITLLKADTIGERIFVGEAESNALRIFDYKRHLLSSTTLGSPPTDVLVEKQRVLVLESGILDPNDEPRGSLVQYDVVGDSLKFHKVLIDSLLRPVFVQQYDFAKDGSKEFVICEFGNNRGRLGLYRPHGDTYSRQVLDASPGAIRVEIRDLTGDGAPDIIALFAQGDERIVLFENDGKGNFTGRQRILARFPPVYGSMYFSMHDFNGDGYPDIVYVNGDNFDYSRVLKPYHGVRILENDGKNNFRERYFFPVYGAARAEVADFDRDGDLDLLITSNFADFANHPERGIIYLENLGGYRFRPYAFSIASNNQWNLATTVDLNHNGWPGVIVGSMNLGNIAKRQRHIPGSSVDLPLLLFENRMRAATKNHAHSPTSVKH
jgi:hypothetical protein